MRTMTREQKLWGHFQQKRAVILEGPPDTGQTHLAMLPIKWLREYNGKEISLEIVQMHPGYAYEDL